MKKLVDPAIGQAVSFLLAEGIRSALLRVSTETSAQSSRTTHPGQSFIGSLAARFLSFCRARAEALGVPTQLPLKSRRGGVQESVLHCPSWQPATPLREVQTFPTDPLAKKKKA